MTRRRAKIHVTDVVLLAVVSVATAALAPTYYDLIADIKAAADPLSALLLDLVVPFLFIGIVISAGVSARRRE